MTDDPFIDLIEAFMWIYNKQLIQDDPEAS